MTCIPKELQQAADAAEQRKDQALDRLLEKTGVEVPRGDPFLRALAHLIDADKRALQARSREHR